MEKEEERREEGCEGGGLGWGEVGYLLWLRLTALDKQGELGRRDAEFPLKCSYEFEVFLGIFRQALGIKIPSSSKN